MTEVTDEEPSQPSQTATELGILLRAVKQGMGIGAALGAVLGALVGIAFANGDGLVGPVLIWGTVGALAGLVGGFVCAVFTGPSLAVGARYFTAHVWTARLFTALLNGGLLAVVTLLFTNGYAGNGQLTAVAIAFVGGALLGGYSAGYVVTGKSCTVLRRLLPQH